MRFGTKLKNEPLNFKLSVILQSITICGIDFNCVYFWFSLTEFVN